MQNIGLKFKTVGRGLAERFVFIPRPRNVFSLFAKIPLPFLPPLPIFRVFTHLRFLTSVLFFQYFTRVRAVRILFISRREKSTNYSIRLGASSLLSTGYKNFQSARSRYDRTWEEM